MSIYYPAGYPTLDDTMPVLQSLQEAGIDMVEIGIPFSDPMADGPVIQQASTQALRNGMSLRLLFSQLKEMRPKVRIPVILMGYLNPIMQYGFEHFFTLIQSCNMASSISAKVVARPASTASLSPTFPSPNISRNTNPWPTDTTCG